MHKPGVIRVGLPVVPPINTNTLSIPLEKQKLSEQLSSRLNDLYQRKLENLLVRTRKLGLTSQKRAKCCSIFDGFMFVIFLLFMGVNSAFMIYLILLDPTEFSSYAALGASIASVALKSITQKVKPTIVVANNKSIVVKAKEAIRKLNSVNTDYIATDNVANDDIRTFLISLDTIEKQLDHLEMYGPTEKPPEPEPSPDEFIPRSV